MKKSRIFITGSADGLGYAAASNLCAEGHHVVVHVRNPQRLDAVASLLRQGAQVVTGDLVDLNAVQDIAAQVNRIGQMDAIIHNAGIYAGPGVVPVNVVAPYVLTALIAKPSRLIYLSSGMHLNGRPELDNVDWRGERESASYSDSKLFVTTLTMALSRRWPEVICSAVDPGWVPTKMGGPSAPDDLRLGHLTQQWLAVSEDKEALVSGGYWHHQKQRTPHAAAHDAAFQERLLTRLAQVTGISLPGE